MASRGVWQQKHLKYFFCKNGGSSKGQRTYLASDEFQQFKEKNPQIDYEFYQKNGRHPFLSAVYINGFTRKIDLKNLNEEDIDEHTFFSRSSHGRPSLEHRGSGVYGLKKSIQGGWEPNMFGQYPKHALEMRKHTPEFDFEVGTKPVFKRSPDTRIKVDKVRTLEDKLVNKIKDKTTENQSEKYADPLNVYDQRDLLRPKFTYGKIRENIKPFVYKKNKPE